MVWRPSGRVAQWSSGQVTKRTDSPLRILTFALCLLAFDFALSCSPPSPIQNRKSKIQNPAPPAGVELRIKSARVFAEVVSKPEERTLGLMFRRSLAPDSGMLFIFDSADFQRFWMKNTLIPLSIAYIDSRSVITDILEMAPLDTTTPYLSSKPVLYALEMNSGWFQSRSILPGDTIKGIPGP